MTADDLGPSAGGDPISAGPFLAWLESIGRALDGAADADVPCGSCTGCCTSSQFVLIGPDEVDTLAAIPAELLFPAPRMPEGNRLLGYDERGHCPMLVDDACSIYDRRPRTCRTYDCRVFPATGVDLTEPEKGAIAERVRRWRFDLPTPEDRVELARLQEVAAAVGDHPDQVPEARRPSTDTQRAVVAVELHRAGWRPRPA